MQARKTFQITGADRESFLQNLVTNDVSGLSDGLVWAALLTPQGKYLADFFLVPAAEAIFLDVAEPLAADLARRLTMYKLRADVQMTDADIQVTTGTGERPKTAFADPRHPALGWRAYDGTPGHDIDWTALRVTYQIPESGIELIPGESYPLEMGFERLNGVDFRKGCYVGQEVTARMKHKTALKKGLAQVEITGTAAPGTPIETTDGRAAGTLFTTTANRGLAYLRFDRSTGPMRADTAQILYHNRDI